LLAVRIKWPPTVRDATPEVQLPGNTWSSR
jgi:hypothetical protein